MNIRTLSFLSRLWLVCGMILVPLHTSPAAAQSCTTTISAGVVANATWTVAGSPYCIIGSIQVSLLTIEPGVKVLVAGAYQIDVLSTLTAIGTATNPILFSALDPSLPWKGLKFTNTPSGSNLTNCIIEHANDSGLTILNSVPIISHCTIRDNTAPLAGGGISAQLGSGEVLIIADTIITNNTVNPSIAPGNYSGGGLYIIGDSRLKNLHVQ